MALPFLVSLDSQSLTSPAATGPSLKQISYLGRVLIKVSSLEQALSFVQDNFASLDIYVDATSIQSAGDIVDILNAGATNAFITVDQLQAISKEQNVPSSRLVVSVSSVADAAELKNWIGEDKEHKEISAHNIASPEIDAAIAQLADECAVTSIYRSSNGATSQVTLLKNEQERLVSIIPAETWSMEDNERSPAPMLVSAATPDPSTGLYATIVSDESGVTLGFVWSSEKSIAEALRTGTGVYQSRKRGLWYKGASSGDVQELVRIGLDCDGDCFVFVVKQKGSGTNPYLFERCPFYSYDN